MAFNKHSKHSTNWERSRIYYQFYYFVLTITSATRHIKKIGKAQLVYKIKNNNEATSGFSYIKTKKIGHRNKGTGISRIGSTRNAFCGDESPSSQHAACTAEDVGKGSGISHLIEDGKAIPYPAVSLLAGLRGLRGRKAASMFWCKSTVLRR